MEFRAFRRPGHLVLVVHDENAGGHLVDVMKRTPCSALRAWRRTIPASTAAISRWPLLCQTVRYLVQIAIRPTRTPKDLGAKSDEMTCPQIM